MRELIAAGKPDEAPWEQLEMFEDDPCMVSRLDIDHPGPG